tara:strand:- start:21 stop:752 length:732 start_codon:yes stop_codon:yes gene_type:complete
MRYLLFILFSLAVTTVASADDEAAEVIRSSMEKSSLGAKIEYIKESAMPNLYTVGLEGGRVLYASQDGRFFIQGRLYQAKDGGTVNLTDEEERKGIARAISELDESRMIVFTAENESSVVTVFTDTSCPFCHKLHEEIKDINEEGVTIRYLAYPRQGLDSDAYKNMVAVWCSENPREAFTDAIDGDRIESTNCQNPVKDDYLLGQQIGLQGTPSLIFENGAMVSGYRDAETIKKIADSIKGER